MSATHNPISPLPPTVVTPETDALHMDGLFVCDSEGNKIAVLLNKTQIHSGHARRLIACSKAMLGIATDTIEAVVGKSDDNMIVELVNRHFKHEDMLRAMEESLRQHRLDIAQLRETLRAAHAYEIQREALARAPGAQEYLDLCRTLGIGREDGAKTAPESKPS